MPKFDLIDPVATDATQCDYVNLSQYPAYRDWYLYKVAKAILDIFRINPTPWGKDFTLETSNGSVAVGTVFSATFLAANTNTANPTVDGVSLIPGVGVTFSTPFNSLNSAAFTYTASATAELYILKVKP